MSQRIQILPEQLCNKIAAGEVVERPASVVKELVENALDAGAGEILVEVEGGGKRLIRVTDDGHGMHRDDAFLALERHATSKIRSEEDLFRLNTLGFRGEALPSIASVSRLLLQTRSAESLAGWEIYAEGGTVRRTGEVGIPTGTSVEVRNLFFNTPARRKFLRRDETELGHLAEVVTKQALAHPEVRFRLLHNGRPLLEVHPEAGLRERVTALLGRQLLPDLQEVAVEGEGGLRLEGLICRPATSRSTATGIFTFVNGRYIRDRVVQHAVMEGFRNLLMKGRYPVAVLFLGIDPALVDVNVHPTKHEVRFRDQRLVHDFIASSVRETLRGADHHRGASPVSPEPEGGQRTPEPPGEGSEGYRERVQEALARYGGGVAPPRPRGDSLAALPAPLPLGTFEEKKGFFSSLRVIGQFRGSYLLCQDGDDLVLVDQHAAHERVRFEGLRRQQREGRIESQSLLFPEILELDHRQAALFSENLDELEGLGFKVEPFGPGAFALTALPRVLSGVDALGLVRDVAGELDQQGSSGLAEDALESVLMLMACHGAVKANQELSPAQIRALFGDLDEVDFNAHCPHGRPVMIRLTLAEVERLFKRA